MSASSSSPPETRAAARGRHFGSCGGCALQDLPYEAQLERKALRVQTALSKAGCETAVRTLPSPDPWYYRNKMEFSFGSPKPQPDVPSVPAQLGLKPKGRWYDVIDLEECHLLSPEAPGLLANIRHWAAREGLAAYHTRRGTGLLRHLVVREAKNGKDRMVALVTAPGRIPEGSFLASVAPYPATTVLWGINPAPSDTAACATLKILKGDGTITETLTLNDRHMRFKLGLSTFFQTNTRGAQVLYGVLREWLAGLRPARLFDLYCGAGAIGLAVADLCGSVLGIESNPAAVSDGRGNAADNGVGNAEFRAGAVESLLPALGACDAAVADPPRAGLHPKAARALEESGPAHLLYVSCNPEALTKDLLALKIAYEVQDIRAVDLFPHTEHVETAALLRRTH